jgi:hypothetical protein
LALQSVRYLEIVVAVVAVVAVADFEVAWALDSVEESE